MWWSENEFGRLEKFFGDPKLCKTTTVATENQPYIVHSNNKKNKKDREPIPSFVVGLAKEGYPFCGGPTWETLA